MNIIKFNNSVEMEVINYNKNTEFSTEGIIRSNGYCSGNVEDASTILTLAENPITSILIYHDDELIYNLTDTNARITSVNEYLEGDKMGIGINLSFDNMQQDVI